MPRQLPLCGAFIKIEQKISNRRIFSVILENFNPKYKLEFLNF